MNEETLQILRGVARLEIQAESAREWAALETFSNRRTKIYKTFMDSLSSSEQLVFVEEHALQGYPNRIHCSATHRRFERYLLEQLSVREKKVNVSKDAGLKILNAFSASIQNDITNVAIRKRWSSATLQADYFRKSARIRTELLWECENLLYQVNIRMNEIVLSGISVTNCLGIGPATIETLDRPPETVVEELLFLHQRICLNIEDTLEDFS